MCTGSDRGIVVVGVDDRPESLNAATYAMEQARALGLCVRLVHAYGSLVGYGQYGALNLGRMERAARTLVGAVAAQLDVPDGVCVEQSVDNASPVDALTAAGSGSRYVVIGRRDKHWVPRLLRGRVASRLSARAPVPVITVPASWRLSDRSDRPVIVALDGQNSSRQPLAFAFAHADRMAAALEVLHAIPHEHGSGDSDRDRAALSDALAQWRARYPDVAVDVHFARGDASQVLAESSADASLLVIGKPHQYPGFGTGLSPLGRTVLRQAACPVAVVPQAPSDAPGAVAYAVNNARPFDAGHGVE